MKKLFLGLVLLCGINLSAQVWPVVTIMDIQFLPDSIVSQGDAPSPLLGDTLTITGVSMVSTVVDPQNDRRPIISAGARWVTYIQDESGAVWGGINVIQHDTTGSNQNTFFDLVDTAQVIQVTGIVEEYYTSTQFAVLLDPIQPVQVLNQLPKRPDPIELSVTDFMENGQVIWESEKYEGMYVVVRNVFTSDRNTSNGTFRINDGNGNYMMMYDQSGYFTLRAHRLTGLTTYEPPADGATLEYIRGIVTTRQDACYLVPLYPGDIKIGVTPPIISSVERDIVIPQPNQAVEISAKVVDYDGSIVSAKVKYRVDGGALNEVDMNPVNDTLYSGTIPGVSTAESIVDFFIVAEDDSGYVTQNPVDTSSNRYFYPVLDRDLTIQDVQFSPYGSGYGAFTGYEVTVTGVVTADTADFGTRVYIQDGNSPWSGIRLYGVEVLKYLKGDNITVTGTIAEVFSITNIEGLDYPANITLNSTGNVLPDPVLLTTGEIDALSNGTVEAEQWESVLVKYENVEVTALSADGANNYGEAFINDGSGDARLQFDESNISYHNGYDPALFDDPNMIFVDEGSTMDGIAGILYYSYGNYKLNPRNDGDFIGVTDVRNEEAAPQFFNLSQNYPNPFNPSTVIRFSLPHHSNVKLVVYDILGREVSTLINNEFKNAGTYNVSFNANNLPSGVYFYRITSDNFNDVKKMLLIK